MTRARERREDDVQADADARTLGPATEAVLQLGRDDAVRVADDVVSRWAVSDDQAKESEADRIAADATRDHAGPALEGDALAPGLQAALGKAAPHLQGLGDVRFDDGPDAARAADELGAHAFTKGTDVALGPGEASNASVVAHEAVHAVQHSGDGMVHAKMRGARAALGDLGGSKSTKKIQLKTNWDKVLDGVAAYEALEDALLANGEPDGQALMAAKPKMVKALTKVLADIKAWQKANDSKGESKKSSKWTEKKANFESGPESDERSKAERRQAIALLLPRVNTELGLLQSKDGTAWTKSLGLSSSKVSTTGKSDSGQKNTVSELTYQTESGEFSGFFKGEKGFAGDMETHEAQTGIEMADPNYGARAVAMYKLDRLFNANVTARAEFATHVDKNGKTVFGTVLESAKGTKGADLAIGQSKEHAKQLGPGAIVQSDPTFQRAMNKLQIFDAICGQLDRHDGNYYVQTDERGNVTGVTGIDLDMAFGKNLKGDMKAGSMAHNFKGIPDKIDAEFGEKLLTVDAKDVADALRGLLSDAEIAATIDRFETVKGLVRQLKSSSSLVSKWDETTISTLAGKNVGFNSAKESYSDNVGAGTHDSMSKQVKQLGDDAFASGRGPAPFSSSAWARQIGDQPDVVRRYLTSVFMPQTPGAVGAFHTPVTNAAFDNRVGADTPEFAMRVANEILNDDATFNRLIVHVQENPGAIASNQIAKMAPLVNGAIATALAAVKNKKKTPEGGGRRSLIGSNRGR